MKMNGGAAVVKVMEEFGARVVYGIPGGQTLSVTDAIYDSETVRFVHTRHENTAACAADAWGRITGEPGICLATTGPGATNLITGIGGAYRDSSPMIALLFQNKLPDAGKGDAQESDHASLFGSIVKAYIPVRSADTVVWAMREAYRIAVTGRPGPVVVDLYRDVVEDQTTDYIPAAPESYALRSPIVPAETDIQAAAALLMQSKKPCLWCGNGVKISGAGKQVARLAEVLGAPIVTTYNGMGAVDSGSPNLLGPRSRHGGADTRAAIEESDCVVLIGSSLSAISTNRWSLAVPSIIQIDIEASAIGRHYPVALGIQADAGQTAVRLAEALSGAGYHNDGAFLKEMQARRKDIIRKLALSPIGDPEASPVPPVAFMKVLEKLLREDSILAVDAGNPGAWTHLLDFQSGMTYMKPVNYGNMGFGIPAAIACKMACPEREVLALLGDGSFGMTMADLETAAREGCGIIVLLLNDNAYGNIRQEELFKTGKPRYIGVDFPDIDYVDVVKPLGCDGAIVRTAGELPAAMEKARASKVPFVIEVKLDGSFTVWPEAF